jgi:hypothetical protein
MIQPLTHKFRKVFPELVFLLATTLLSQANGDALPE